VSTIGVDTDNACFLQIRSIQIEIDYLSSFSSFFSPCPLSSADGDSPTKFIANYDAKLACRSVSSIFKWFDAF
jgi:hypothetical protein